MSQKITPTAALKQASLVIAVADTALSKAAALHDANETRKKATAEHNTRALDLIKKAGLVDINQASEVEAVRTKLAEEHGVYDILTQCIDNLVKLDGDFAKVSQERAIDGPPPERPTGAKVASLGKGGDLPIVPKTASDKSLDYEGQSNLKKRAADETYLNRIGVQVRK
jgi:hypothetical protein